MVVRLSVLSYSWCGENDNMIPPHHHVPPHHTSSHARRGGQHRLRGPRHGAARQVGHRGGHLHLQQHEPQPLGKLETSFNTSSWI